MPKAWLLRRAKEMPPKVNTLFREYIHVTIFRPFFASLVMFFTFYPRFLRLRIQRDIHCTKKVYIESHVEIFSENKLWSLKLGLILNSLPLSYLDETCYIDSFRDGICAVCIFFSRNSPLPLTSFSPNLSARIWTIFEPRILNPVLIKTFIK